MLKAYQQNEGEKQRQQADQHSFRDELHEDLPPGGAPPVETVLLARADGLGAQSETRSEERRVGKECLE